MLTFGEEKNLEEVVQEKLNEVEGMIPWSAQALTNSLQTALQTVAIKCSSVQTMIGLCWNLRAMCSELLKSLAR